MRIEWIVNELHKIFKEHPEIKEKLEKDPEYSLLIKMYEFLYLNLDYLKS